MGYSADCTAWYGYDLGWCEDLPWLDEKWDGDIDEAITSTFAGTTATEPDYGADKDAWVRWRNEVRRAAETANPFGVTYVSYGNTMMDYPGYGICLESFGSGCTPTPLNFEAVKQPSNEAIAALKALYKGLTGEDPAGEPEWLLSSSYR